MHTHTHSHTYIYIYILTIHKLLLISINLPSHPCFLSIKKQKRSIVSHVIELENKHKQTTSVFENATTSSMRNENNRNEQRETSYLTRCASLENVSRAMSRQTAGSTIMIERNKQIDRKPMIQDTFDFRDTLCRSLDEKCMEERGNRRVDASCDASLSRVSQLRRTSDSDQCRMKNKVPSCQFVTRVLTQPRDKAKFLNLSEGTCGRGRPEEKFLQKINRLQF